jgi:hypothetical protein
MNARLIAALSLAAVAATGCVPNDASVRIHGLCSIPDTCLFPPECEAIWIGKIRFDPFPGTTSRGEPVDGSLVWPVQFDNQLEPNNDATAGRVDTHTAWIESYVISYSTSVASLADVEIPISSHPVPPAGASTGIIPIVPASVSAFLTSAVTGLADLTAEVKAKGRYADGSSFETGPFTVVVEISPNDLSLEGSDAHCQDLTGSPTSTYAGACPQPGQTAQFFCSGGP